MFFCFQSKVPVPVSFGCRRYHRVCTGLAEKAFTFLTQVIIINIKSYHKYGDSNLRIINENSFLRTKVRCIFCSLIANYWKFGKIIIIFYFFQEVYAEWVCDFCYNGKGFPPVKFKS